MTFKRKDTHFLRRFCLSNASNSPVTVFTSHSVNLHISWAGLTSESRWRRALQSGPMLPWWSGREVIFWPWHCFSWLGCFGGNPQSISQSLMGVLQGSNYRTSREKKMKVRPSLAFCACIRRAPTAQLPGGSGKLLEGEKEREEGRRGPGKT